jgi:hypothetical protein
MMIVQIAVGVPVHDDRGPGFACAKAAGKSTCHGAGTSIIAKSPNASARSGAGRRPNDKPNDARMKP